MDSEQAKRLGEYIRSRREAKGISTRQLAKLSDLNQPTVLRIEAGQFLSPGPDKLKALAAALEIPLTDLWSLAGYGFDSDLPSPMPFLRAKYRDLPEQQLLALSADVAAVLERHGIDPYGRPQGNEDEAPGEVPQGQRS